MGEYVTNHHAKALLGEVYCRRERYAKTASAVEPAQQLTVLKCWKTALS
jgi:hypothetical protein